jgi:hypothetical protein
MIDGMLEIMTDDLVKAMDREIILDLKKHSFAPNLPKFITEINEYQEAVKSTAIYPEEVKIVYPALGLAGEVAEGAEVLLNGLFPEGRPTDQSSRLVFSVLCSIVGVGKQAETIKKILRGDGELKLDTRDLAERIKKLSPETIDRLLSEMVGDSNWYSTSLTTDCKSSLENELNKNCNKLAARKEKNTLKGDGENR